MGNRGRIVYSYLIGNLHLLRKGSGSLGVSEWAEVQVKSTKPGLSHVFDFSFLSFTHSDSRHLRPKNYKRHSLTEVADVPVSQTPSPRDSSVNEYAALLCDTCRSKPGKHNGPKICQQSVHHLQCIFQIRPVL